MLATIFLGSGINKLMNTQATVAQMQAVGIPMPNTLVHGAIAFLLIGGILVVLGWFTRVGTLLLMIFLVLATYFFHPAWKDPSQQIAFMKNLAIFGCLLFLFANGPGLLSIDRRRIVREVVVEKVA